MKFGDKVIVADGFYKGIIGFLTCYKQYKFNSHYCIPFYYKIHPIKQLVNNIPLDDFWVKKEQIVLLEK